MPTLQRHTNLIFRDSLMRLVLLIPNAIAEVSSSQPTQPTLINQELFFYDPDLSGAQLSPTVVFSCCSAKNKIKMMQMLVSLAPSPSA